MADSSAPTDSRMHQGSGLSVPSSWIAATPPCPPASAPPPPPPLPSVVECRCGIEHGDRFDCLEMRSFTMLYQAHIALSQNPQLAFSIPRNPSLANLMLHSVAENPLTVILGSTLLQFEVQNVETLFGLYFLAYRLMRVRAPLFPRPPPFRPPAPLTLPPKSGAYTRAPSRLATCRP